MTQTLATSIGAAVRRLREVRGISQLALALGAAVDRRYMSDVETGKRNPSVMVLQRIAGALGLSLSALLQHAEREMYGPLPTESLDALRQWLTDRDFEDTLLFEAPDFLDAISGITDDGRLIYSYPRMVEHLVASDGMTPDEAAEFIDYNTVRALPYMGERAPIIMYDITD